MSLDKWFKEKWVDIGSKKADTKRKYPKCVPLAKARRMTEGQRKSAVARKRQAGNPGGKPNNISTFTKRYYGGMIDT